MTQENKIQEHDQEQIPSATEDVESKKEARAQRINDSRKLLEKLTEAYPVIFPHPKDGRPVALAIGLHKELSPIVQEWGFTAVTLRSSLAWYTKQLRYQKALLHATHRVNLDGSQAEEIPEEHKKLAQERITSIESWLAENRPNALNKPTSTKPRTNTNSNKPRRPAQKNKPKPETKRQEKSAAPAQSLDEKMQSLVEKFNH